MAMVMMAHNNGNGEGHHQHPGDGTASAHKHPWAWAAIYKLDYQLVKLFFVVVCLALSQKSVLLIVSPVANVTVGKCLIL